jgi:uncharacterized protein (TIGR03086 family)
MTTDLTPATTIAAQLIRGTRDDQLTTPTPCGAITVGELLDHIDSLCAAFATAATKTLTGDSGPTPTPDATRLGGDWRLRIPAHLDQLAVAWQPASAWADTTQVGGNTVPAEVAGAAAVNEIIVHSWDLAIATHQPYPDHPALTEPLQTAYQWVREVAAQYPDGSPGLFGPPVAVSGDASLLDQLIGLTGRNPAQQ